MSQTTSWNTHQMLEADGDNTDEYAKHVIDSLTSDLEKMNEYGKNAEFEIDSWISCYDAPEDKYDTGTKPFMTVDVTIKPIDTKNLGKKDIKAISLSEKFIDAVQAMKGLGFYLGSMDTVQIVDNEYNKNPFETILVFYSEF